MILNFSKFPKYIIINLIGLFALQNCYSQNSKFDANDSSKRKEILGEIIKFLPQEEIKNGIISYQDSTFEHWLQRTGELPPNFDSMVSLPFLPDPLVLDEGRSNVPIVNGGQWNLKRDWIKKKFIEFITGTIPPAPKNMISEILEDEVNEGVRIQKVRLRFGPDHKAEMIFQLMIPPGEGSFPVFMTQWNHLAWAALAVRRGYIGCVYAASDQYDLTKRYDEIWAGKYTFSLLMRRAFGASRVIDYLVKQPYVNKTQIGIAGHSRNGKQSLWAAAFDERIKAVIPSSGNSGGGGLPWRYSRHKFGGEDIGLLASAQPAWYNPRLRFFVGRENKLPIDDNLLAALIAPRGLMLTTSKRESDNNQWGLEASYNSAKRVYELLGKDQNLRLSIRDGRHGIRTKDLERFMDFFDYIFGRGKPFPQDNLIYDYSFDKWKNLSKINVDVKNFEKHTPSRSMVNTKGYALENLEQWKLKMEDVKKWIKWALGNEPPKIRIDGPKNLNECNMVGDDYPGTMIKRPKPSDDEIGWVSIGPNFGQKGFGEQIYGYLYYPKAFEEGMKSGKKKLPIVIFLHKYNYSNGFWDNQGFDHEKMTFLRSLVSLGYGVFYYEISGFGDRMEEATKFYNRYPKWSRMGVFVSDVSSAVTALINLDFVDSSRISIVGNSLGGTVALYAAALDKRIKSVAAVSGFTPMRTDIAERGSEGLRGISDIRGIIPKLGFFIGHEDRIPYDFDEIVGCIAPRPVLIISPLMDQDLHIKDIENSVERSREIYELHGLKNNIRLFEPLDISRFYNISQDELLKWLSVLKK